MRRRAGEGGCGPPFPHDVSLRITTIFFVSQAMVSPKVLLEPTTSRLADRGIAPRALFDGSATLNSCEWLFSSISSTVKGWTSKWWRKRCESAAVRRGCGGCCRSVPASGRDHSVMDVLIAQLVLLPETPKETLGKIHRAILLHGAISPVAQGLGC